MQRFQKKTDTSCYLNIEVITSVSILLLLLLSSGLVFSQNRLENFDQIIQESLKNPIIVEIIQDKLHGHPPLNFQILQEPACLRHIDALAYSIYEQRYKPKNIDSTFYDNAFFIREHISDSLNYLVLRLKQQLDSNICLIGTKSDTERLVDIDSNINFMVQKSILNDKCIYLELYPIDRKRRNGIDIGYLRKESGCFLVMVIYYNELGEINEVIHTVGCY